VLAFVYRRGALRRRALRAASWFLPLGAGVRIPAAIFSRGLSLSSLQRISETIESRLERTVALLSFSVASAVLALVGPVAEQRFFTACAVLGGFAMGVMLMALESARASREEALDELLLMHSRCEEAKLHAERLATLPRRRSLARQLEGIVRDANTCSLGLRMMFSAPLVRRFGPRMCCLGRMLRDPNRPVPGEAVALTRLLLTPGRSPLTHREPDERAAERLLDRIEQEITGVQFHTAA
jgi:hypothetical protein